MRQVKKNRQRDGSLRGSSPPIWKIPERLQNLIANCTVILNLEGLDMEVAQRIIDFTSGSCYSIGGSLQKVSSYIFILTPASVDITGDYQQILSGAFDIPSIRTEY